MTRGNGKPAEKGFIYFLRRADGVGPLKIGCSRVPAQRLRAQQVWSPEPLEIVAFVPGTFADEKRLHRQFEEYRLHGEWFEAAPAVLAVMSRAATSGALPPPPANDRVVRVMARYSAGDTLQAIANEFGVSRQRIEQIIRKEGGAKRGPRSIKRAPVWSKLEQVRSLASAGCTTAEIADAVGDTKANVHNACRAEGIVVQRPKRKVSDRIAAEAFDVAADYKAGLSTYMIAEKYHRHQPDIYRLLRVAGVKPNRVHRSVNCLRMSEIIAAYKGGATIAELCAQHDRAQVTMRKLLVKAGVLRTREESEAIRIARVTAANRKRAA